MVIGLAQGSSWATAATQTSTQGQLATFGSPLEALANGVVDVTDVSRQVSGISSHTQGAFASGSSCSICCSVHASEYTIMTLINPSPQNGKQHLIK